MRDEPPRGTGATGKSVAGPERVRPRIATGPGVDGRAFQPPTTRSVPMPFIGTHKPQFFKEQHRRKASGRMEKGWSGNKPPADQRSS